ncbi:related to UDP-glucose 6-dehydrogenase [Rhynchosporium graminicola]|uniref:UDP-glucose 6-dehydrogenase n=1 Tax=Rhynchosporium graminicola TaxID=2792576 RepID=A0A1E1JZT7_9HELO|nr:related to UDP-glucose 6-dehydrogenase [Rhynchosporium commune]
MDRKASMPISEVDSEQYYNYVSTAPTTPDGSLTFSPILQAMRLHDALEDASVGGITRITTTTSLDQSVSSNTMVKNICCIGAGYVGGPTASVIAFQNPDIKVTVVDRDPRRIAQWNSKHLPIHEPGLDYILRVGRDGSRAFRVAHDPTYSCLSSSESTSSCTTSECESQCQEAGELEINARETNLYFSTEVSKNISEADIILIAVNTPTKMRGLGAGRATDVTALEAVTREIALHAKSGAILVEKSTVPCRTSELIRDTIQVYRPNEHFEILSNPEFLAEGTAINDLLNPSRIIIGSSSTISGRVAAATLASVYSWVPISRIITTNTWSSELSKLVANAMLAQRISSINSISAICEKTGADISEISHSVGLDPRIGPKFLQAGVGFGGSCFQKDILSLVYLAETLGLEEVAEYWQQVLTINNWQRIRFTRRIIRCLNGTVVGKKLTILGYAFKKGTSDTRESPALECIKSLLEDAPMEIAVYDPYCNPSTVSSEIGKLLGEDVLRDNGGCIHIYADVYAACEGSAAVLIMTECDEFRTASKTSEKSSTATEEKKSLDPRPFAALEPTETEILALNKHLSTGAPLPGSIPDSLQRLNPERNCGDGCRDCENSLFLKSVAAGSGTTGIGQPLDWSRIAYRLQKPKWVFDGRGVLAADVMEGLGVRLEKVGAVGWEGIGGK